MGRSRERLCQSRPRNITVMERTAIGLQMLDELHDGGEPTPRHLVGLCMHEVRTLESSAFERIQQVKDGLDSQLEEVGVHLAELAGQMASLEVREERAGRATVGLAELQRELGLPEVELHPQPGQQWHRPQHTVEAIVELLLALRASTAQAMRDQTAKTEHDLCRSIKGVTAVISASQEALRSDLQQEVLQAHSELGNELSAKLAGLAARLDEGQRARDIKQDELEGKVEAQSATSILARLERLERSIRHQSPTRNGSQGTPRNGLVRVLSARPGDAVACGGTVPASSAAWQSQLGADGAAPPRTTNDWTTRLRQASMKQAWAHGRHNRNLA
mmetsp:Transcript_78648/g.151935  ORF Transcript_78648/g.151935 Transcript_78648/m.151935 type:complete len:332 (+) Transcript_78648:68-1063(+)